MYSDLLTGFNATLVSLKALTQVATSVATVELRIELTSKIADLQSDILAARQQMLEMQQRYEELLKENQRLTDHAARHLAKKPPLQWGCYKFDGEEGLFCSGCYDSKGERNQTSRIDARKRQCQVCRVVIYS